MPNSIKYNANSFNKTYGTKNINLNNFNFVSAEEVESQDKKQLTGKVQKVWKDVFKRFFKNKWNIIFSIILLILVIMVIIVPMVSKYAGSDTVNNATTNEIRFLKPEWEGKNWNVAHKVMPLQDYYKYINRDGHGLFDKKDVISFHKVKDAAGVATIADVQYRNKLAVGTIMGTDSIGRDVWTRLFLGSRWSLGLAVFVATIETIIGTVIGIYIGYHVGSRVDTISMRFIEIFKSVPSLLWMFIFAMIIGTSFFSMAIVLILVGWVGPVYLARMYTLRIKDAEFIKSAKTIGLSETAILFKHVLPNIIGRLLVSFVHRIPSVIFAETTLVFLGMHIGGEEALSIGNLIQEARSLEAIDGNVMFAVSISIFLLGFSVSIQIIANGIRDAFDPKTAGSK